MMEGCLPISAAAAPATPVAPAASDPTAEQEEQDKAVDKEHMMTIWKALMAFQKAKGKLPDYLSDMVPEFLPDQGVLLSPTKDAKSYKTDPKVKTPYVYEFRADKIGDGMPTYHEAKPDQLKEYGEAILPILRCFSHGNAMNVAYRGDYYESPGYWETSTVVQDMIREQGIGPGMDRGEFVDLRIVDDATGQPVAGADVQLTHRKIYTSVELPVRVIKTDASGKVRVPVGMAALPAQRNITVSVYKPGFFGPRETWREDKMPHGEQTWRLKPATSVGGRVRNADGTPLAGALVAVWVLPHFREGLDTPLGQEPVPQIADECYTDAQGRWHCDSVPPNFTEMTVKVTHREIWIREFRTSPLGLAPRRGQNDSPTAPVQSVDRAALLAQKAELRVDPRVEMVILLQKADGSPASYQEVTIAAESVPPEDPSTNRGMIRSSQWFMRSHGARSGPMGRVNFFWSEPMDVTLSAYPTKDSGLVIRQVKVTRGEMPPIEMRATPRRRVAGKVVDANGKPMEGVRVVYVGAPGTKVEKEVTKTNKNGDFAWDAAPSSEVGLIFERPGFVQSMEWVPLEKKEPLKVQMIGEM